MPQQSDKPYWKTPELMVIVRSTPQENVLISCKGTGINGPGFTHGNCKPGKGGGGSGGSACHEEVRS
jgi:hypothetical protein